jgi:hypothetical protein
MNSLRVRSTWTATTVLRIEYTTVTPRWPSAPDTLRERRGEVPNRIRLRGARFGDAANLDLWVKEIKTLAPRCRVVTMGYFESFAP